MTGVVLAPIGLALCGLGGWLSVQVYREVDEFANIGDYSVEVLECEVNDGVATARGTIKNLDGRTHSYHITVVFQRPGTSNTLYTGGAEVDEVGSNDTASWTVNEVVDDEALDCIVDTVSGPLPFGQS